MCARILDSTTVCIRVFVCLSLSAFVIYNVEQSQYKKKSNYFHFFSLFSFFHKLSNIPSICAAFCSFVIKALAMRCLNLSPPIRLKILSIIFLLVVDSG